MQRQLPGKQAELMTVGAEPPKVREFGLLKVKPWLSAVPVIGRAVMGTRILDDAFGLVAPVVPVSAQDEMQLRGMAQPACDFTIRNMVGRGVQGMLEPDRIEVMQERINQMGIAGQEHDQRLEPGLCERPIYKEPAERR
jgi:hypothetical protein